MTVYPRSGGGGGGGDSVWLLLLLVVACGDGDGDDVVDADVSDGSKKLKPLRILLLGKKSRWQKKGSVLVEWLWRESECQNEG